MSFQGESGAFQLISGVFHLRDDVGGFNGIPGSINDIDCLNANAVTPKTIDDPLAQGVIGVFKNFQGRSREFKGILEAFQGV